MGTPPRGGRRGKGEDNLRLVHMPRVRRRGKRDVGEQEGDEADVRLRVQPILGEPLREDRLGERPGRSGAEEGGLGRCGEGGLGGGEEVVG